jgi:aspartate/tyrosine/aromatic aminotransferase
MFDRLEMAARDPILGLTEAFEADPNPNKLSLAVGVYRDGAGNTPVLECVRRARLQIVEQEKSKDYLPMTGSRAYVSAVQKVVFGEKSPLLAAGRVTSAHTPGGTGGLRVAAELIAAGSASAQVWLSDPTWPNHGNIFAAAGLKTRSYPYFDARRLALDFDAFAASLKDAGPGDVVVLHGCCHNPTGADLSLEQWRRIAELARERGFLPLIDFAYQGWGLGIEEDAVGLRAVCEVVPEAVVCSSFSKNFGLYNERVGALHVVVPDSARAEITSSQVKRVIRANYSNPPAHGAAIVSVVLGDPGLRKLWVQEVDAMRERILGVRKRFVAALAKRKVARDFSFIEQQRGMFSFTGLTKDQVKRLREEFAIYIVDSGRINVAGILDSSLDRVADAIAAVIA